MAGRAIRDSVVVERLQTGNLTPLQYEQYEQLVDSLGGTVKSTLDKVKLPSWLIRLLQRKNN